MEKPVSVTVSASLEHIRRGPSKEKSAAIMGKFTQAIRGYFYSCELTHEAWVRLERKKQISHSEQSHPIHHTRLH